MQIGIGSDLNLPFYTANVERAIGIDPSPKLLAIAGKAASHLPIPLELTEGSAEAIPLYNRGIDRGDDLDNVQHPRRRARA